MKKIIVKPGTTAASVIAYHYHESTRQRVDDKVCYIVPKTKGHNSIVITRPRHCAHNTTMCTVDEFLIRDRGGTSSSFICTIEEIGDDIIYRVFDKGTLTLKSDYVESELINDCGPINNIIDAPRCPHCNSSLKHVKWIDYKIICDTDEKPMSYDIDCIVDYDPNKNDTFGYDLMLVCASRMGEIMNDFGDNVTYQLMSFKCMEKDDIDSLIELITDARNTDEHLYTTSPVPGPYCLGCGASLRDHFRKNIKEGIV